MRFHIPWKFIGQVILNNRHRESDFGTYSEEGTSTPAQQESKESGYVLAQGIQGCGGTAISLLF